MALLIIDTQNALVNGNLFEYEKFVENIESLIYNARKNHVEVIYIVHDDGVGSDLTMGTDGFKIYEPFKPLEGEKVFTKRVNSAFKDTGLLDYLRKKNETEIIVAGLQTDKCINATVVCGFEYGFHVTVPAFANSTVSNAFMDGEASYRYFNAYMWPERYAECLPMEKTLKRMEH